MIYKLIVNAAFLAAGYYIGKQIGQSKHIREELQESENSASIAEKKPVKPKSKKS